MTYQDEAKYFIPSPVTKRENGKAIPLDEPVILFRAQDRILPDLLTAYWHLCKQAGCEEAHLFRISLRLREVNDWQTDNLSKLPDL